MERNNNTAKNNTPAPESQHSTNLRRQAQPNLLVKIQDYFFLFLRNWKWFVLSLVVTLSIAYYNNKKAVPMYQRQASILIKGDDRSSANNEVLKELGINQTPSSVTNEIIALTTSEVAAEIGRRLHLDYNYYHQGRFHNDVLYGTDLPVNVEIYGLNDRDDASMTLSLRPDSVVIISDLSVNGASAGKSFRTRLNREVQSPIGTIIVTTTPSYTNGLIDNIYVRRVNLPSTGSRINGKLRASLRGSNSTMIDISYVDESPQRAEDVLNTLVTVYNENWIRDRNLVTISTNEFIKERIRVLEGELGSVENSIANYKSVNLMPDVNARGAMEVGKADAASSQSMALDNQIYMTKYVRSYLTDGLHENQLLPSNSGIRSTGIEGQIGEYNTLLLRRNNHLANSSAQNPMVQDLEQNLLTLRNTIIQSLDNELMMLETQKNTVNEKLKTATARIAENPGQVTYLQSMEREQSVKESLYLFLLQKREENELSQAFTAYNSRLIEPPHGSWAPISPIPSRAYTIALILGLGIPAALLIIVEGFNTAIRGRKDLEGLAVPFVGETPLDSGAAKAAAMEKKRKKRALKKGKTHHEDPPELVVKEKSRNVMNEAFRVVRSNLEFILGFDQKHHVIMVTSMNPSSGKTFITANLGTSLGLNGKRVVCVDLDMRKGSLSKYVGRPRQGVSNYLSGQLDDYRDLIITLGEIDILPCGTLPPNPAELLYQPTFDKMIEELRAEYDYVFLDCPPIEIVADAAIINRYVDMTLFVVRAQVMDRAFLPDIEKWYEEKRYKNLAIMLNGTTDAFSHYGYHKYGYRYGYHYGSYGYGYGNGQSK